MGLPDRFVEHGERGELLGELGLDVDGIAAAARRLSGREAQPLAALAVDAARR
jgi:1-deoxy-D-xylulose-5-phosphate synthase